jgi:glycosyltransferase involved in cell wall biosynthesis
MKIAWFTPFCKSSAIGRYSAMILDELAKEHEVVVFATGLRDGVASHRPALPTERVDGRGGSPDLCRVLEAFDIAVYNLGDTHLFHGDIWRTQVEHPGVAIVHDVSTWNLLWNVHFFPKLDMRGWLAQVEYSHGPAAREWGTLLHDGRALRGGSQEESLRYNMARSCVRNAVGVVVHGEWARHTMAEWVSPPVVHIDFPAFLTPQGSHRVAPSGDKVQLLTIGAVNSNKAADLVVEALSSSDLLRGKAEYTIAGGMGDHPYLATLHRLIRQRGLENVVRLIDRPDDTTLHRLIGEADVLVNLRYPHLGECSGSLQEALFHGKPTVVWAHGYYDEFPADVVCKVDSLSQLIVTLERLVASPEERQRRGERSSTHAAERFQTERYCRTLVSFLETCCHDRPVCRLADRLSARLSEFYRGPAPAEIVQRLANEVDSMARSRSVKVPIKEVA